MEHHPLLTRTEEALTEDQFDVLVLRLEGKTFKAIGALLGRSEVACRKSWSQSRKQWRGLFGIRAKTGHSD